MATAALEIASMKKELVELKAEVALLRKKLKLNFITVLEAKEQIALLKKKMRFDIEIGDNYRLLALEMTLGEALLREGKNGK